MAGSSNQIKIAIILVNWNGADDTIACLHSLLDLRGDNFSVIIADNGSTDGSLEKITHWAYGADRETAAEQTHDTLGSYPRRITMDVRQHDETAPWSGETFITFLSLGWNSGFAYANNRAIEVALGCDSIEYFWLLNNDTVVEPDALIHLVKRIDLDSKIGICGSTLVYFHNRSQVQGVGFRYIAAQCRGYQIDHMQPMENLSDQHAVEHKMNYIIGASMLVRRQFIEQIGLLSEIYFLYFEEFDWAIRGKGIFRLGWAPKSIVYHKEGGSIGSDTRGRPSDTSTFYMSRSLLIFYRQHFVWLLPVAWARLGFNASRFLVQRDWAAFRALSRGVLASFVKYPTDA